MNGYLRTLLRSGVILVLVTGGSGCGGPTAAPSPQPTTTASESPFPTPEPEPTPPPEQAPTPEETTPPDDDPVISLPSLPIGGESLVDDDEPARQCVHISWSLPTEDDEEFPEGYAVEVTGTKFSGSGFEVVKEGCGTSAPTCLGLVLRPDSNSCDLAVRARPEADLETTVGLKGILYCPKSVGMARCRAFAERAAAAQLHVISLKPPPQTPAVTTPSASEG